MVSSAEKKARIQEFFRFSQQEVIGLVAAVLVTTFIFSFRDWGGVSFDLIMGLRNFFLVLLATMITFLIRLSSQKILGLEDGYLAEFKVWFAGLGIALAVAFISKGLVPLVLIGTMVNRFMVKQRLGELRYGFAYSQNAGIANRGVIVNLGLATFFSAILIFYPSSYFLSKIVLLNLVMALCSMLPLPRLEGLGMFFGGRAVYYALIIGTILYWVLLLTRTKIGLVIAAIILVIVVTLNNIKGSEK